MYKGLVIFSGPKRILKILSTRNLCTSKIWILCISTALFLKGCIPEQKYFTCDMLQASLILSRSTANLDVNSSYGIAMLEKLVK